MNKFVVLEDIYFFSNQIIFEKGEIIQLEDTLDVQKAGFSGTFKLEDLKSDKRFKQIDNTEYTLNIKELEDDEDLQIKNYRIQVNIKTNRKKLIEIERFLRETLENMV